MRENFFYNWLPQALLLGISEEKFWDMNPRKLEPYKIAFEIKEEKRMDELDYTAWLMGLYNERAFSVPLTQFASGLSRKRTDASYFEKPISKMQKKESILPKPGEELTEEEKKRRTELLFGQLSVLALNHKLENAKNEESVD